MKLPGLVAVALLALGNPDAAWARQQVSVTQPTTAVCGIDQYLNVSGHCVHRPMQSSTVPIGATARCRDGSYSFSQNHRGTCSHHGGVAKWL